MHNIPIFCVNLERAKERKEKITQEWIDGIGLPIQFWNAYDRRNIASGNFIFNYDPIETKKFLDRELSDGEIACATSFCMLYEYILTKQYKEVIIMEDDISPLIKTNNDLYEIIQAGKKEFPEAEMIVLHEINSNIQKIEQIIKKEYCSQCDVVPWGNMLLYITDTGVDKLYNFLNKLLCPADYAQRYLYQINTLKVIVANKSLCFHNTNDSYIGNDIRFSRSFRNFIQ